MAPKLSHIIEFVADMNRAVAFYRDVIRLPLKFQSPQWSEFATGEVTFALHPASEKNAGGKIELGFSVPDLSAFHTEMQGKASDFQWNRRNRTSGECSRNSWIPKAHMSA